MEEEQYLPSVGMSESAGVRYLHLGDTPWVQGCMRIKRPMHLELEYIQRMMAWLLWFPLEDEAAVAALRTVQLGLGAASLTKFCGQVLGCQNLAIELNPSVIAACHTWFALPPDNERQQVLCADADTWLRSTINAGRVDGLMVDIYDEDAQAPVLNTPQFYDACRAVLSEQGAMSINLFGRDQQFERTLKTLGHVFGPKMVSYFKPTREGNAIVLCGKTEGLVKPPVLEQRMQDLQAIWGIRTAPWSRALRHLV